MFKDANNNFINLREVFIYDDFFPKFQFIKPDINFITVIEIIRYFDFLNFASCYVPMFNNFHWKVMYFIKMYEFWANFHNYAQKWEEMHLNQFLRNVWNGNKLFIHLGLQFLKFCYLNSSCLHDIMKKVIFSKSSF